MGHRSFSFQTKLFLAFSLVTILASILPGVFSSRTLYEDRLELAVKQAQTQAKIFKSILQSNPSKEQLRLILQSARELSLRVTIMDKSGKVLEDSSFEEEMTSSLDNHKDRIEIEKAEQYGEGVSIRHSNSLNVDLIYVAQSLDDGKILRVAIPLANIKNSYQTEVSFLSFMVLGVIFFCLLLSIFLASRIRKSVGEMAKVVESISLGNYHIRLREVPGRELQPLADSVNRMAKNIEKQIETSTLQQVQLETILDSLSEGVLVLDHSGQVYKYNPALEKLFPKITRDWIGKQPIEAIPIPELQVQVEKMLQNPQTDSEMMRNISFEFELPSRRSVIVYISRPAKPNPFLGAVVVFYDATKIIRLERVRSDFVSNVSHELRTPLTAIASSAEILMEMKNIDEEYKKFPEIIYKHATSLSRMVSDLLTLARVENDEEAIELTEVSPIPALNEAIGFCQTSLDEKKCKIDIKIPEKAILKANSFLLTQVFRNLLENACRYSQEYGVITITGETAGNFMQFTVADTGEGIPAQYLKRVFERFYQVDKVRSKTSSGLGLSICKHIVERHGGRIWAESPFKGKGTAIMFTIPLLNNPTSGKT